MKERIKVKDIWDIIADVLDHQDVRTLSHSSRWLRGVMSAHPNGYLHVRLPERRSSQYLQDKLEDALGHADRAGRRVEIVVAPDAIAQDRLLGDRILSRMTGSSERLVGLHITLPLGPESKLCGVVQNAPNLRALDVSFQHDWYAKVDLVGTDSMTDPVPPLDLSEMFHPEPQALRHLSITCQRTPITLPTNLGILRGLRSVELCAAGENNDWPADWRAAVSALAAYIPTLNVQLLDVDIEKVDISPLLHGLGNGPLVVAFPETCVAPLYFMVSTADGSVVRRLQWGWGDDQEGLTPRIYAQLAPVANQIEVAHIDCMDLVRGDAPENQPLLSNLRHILVHSTFDNSDALESDTERALGYKRQLMDAAVGFLRCGSGTQVAVWCPHCFNLDAHLDIYAMANGTPRPSA